MNTLEILLQQSVLPKTALVRVDYNITIGSDGSISEPEMFRIDASLHTVLTLLSAGITPVLISHFGRDGDDIGVLVPVLQKLFPVVYVNSWDKTIIDTTLKTLPTGSVLLLPNSRTNSGEESCSLEFVELLTSLAMVYVNDAFSASHRNHATITGVASKLPCYAGFQMVREIESLSRARGSSGKRLVIIGGAKFDTKINLIQYFLDIDSIVYVVGALAHAIYTLRGHNIGLSFIDTKADVSNVIKNPNLFVPETVVVRSLDGLRTVKISEVKDSDQIIDAGLDSLSSIKDKIDQSDTVIWNGPLGLSSEGFLLATNMLQEYLKSSKAFRLVGGGDTVACIKSVDRESVADFVSTGGGAMLDFLLHGTLVGVQALEKTTE